jgi:hypothetical protein
VSLVGGDPGYPCLTVPNITCLNTFQNIFKIGDARSSEASVQSAMGRLWPVAARGGAEGKILVTRGTRLRGAVARVAVH